MALFDFFKRRGKTASSAVGSENGADSNLAEAKGSGAADSYVAPGIESMSLPIDEIYRYLQVDFESRGYEDALSNPDVSYRDMNKRLIVSNLKVLFKKVKQSYSDSLYQTDFHIKSRSQAGLIDLVEQLRNRKEIMENHKAEVVKMEQDLEKEEDYLVGMLLSYERGFLRGLAALSLETLNIKK